MIKNADKVGVETYKSIEFVKFEDELGEFYLQRVNGSLIDPYLKEVGTENGLVYGIVSGEQIKRIVTDDGVGKPIRNA